MKLVFTPQGVHALDAECELTDGIPASVLMENAVASASSIILERFPNRQRILVACGNGNNGGDGFGIARMLSSTHHITVCADMQRERMSAATAEQVDALPESVDIIDVERGRGAANSFDVFIDAAYGVGFKGSLQSSPFNWLHEVNRPFRIAVDIPSGLNGLTGVADEFAFKADITITMEGYKLGMFAESGPDVCGEIVVASIGAKPETSARHAIAYVMDNADISTLLPERKRNTSKFDYGRVLVIAGSQGMRGAASLTAHAALRAGAGLVELITTSVHPLTPREIITHTVAHDVHGFIDPSAKKDVQQLLKKATVVAVGPGLGNSQSTIEMLASIVNALPDNVPVVIDADGLRMCGLLERNMQNVVLTPHHGELRHIVGNLELKLDTLMERMEAATLPSFARNDTPVPRSARNDLSPVVHLKGWPSVSTDGKKTYLTIAGNPGMATAGMGDVLTGIIAGLCAQHIPVLEATALGSYLHAKAADQMLQRKRENALIASDVIDQLLTDNR